MRQYTYERIDGDKTYQWWVTLRFVDEGLERSGRVLMLSRDAKRSTRPAWVCVGHYAKFSSEVVFTVNTTNTQIAAAHIWNVGYNVVGATIHAEWQTRDYSPQRDGYPARYTVPKTIRRALGEAPTGDRERSLDLGLHAKGREQAAEEVAVLANKASLGDGALAAKRALVARKRKPVKATIPTVAEMAARLAKLQEKRAKRAKR